MNNELNLKTEKEYISEINTKLDEIENNLSKMNDRLDEIMKLLQIE
jgi:archaellum component FlaC